MDLPRLDKVQRNVNILEALDSQLRSGGIATKGLVGEDLEEVDEDDTVGEVAHQVIDVDAADFKFVVEPGKELISRCTLADM